MIHVVGDHLNWVLVPDSSMVIINGDDCISMLPVIQEHVLRVKLAEDKTQHAAIDIHS